MGQEFSVVGDDTPTATLRERSLAAVAEYIKSGKARRIIVMTGAGISTAAGIPDFRSPKTGLYANLARLNLPHAEAVFDLSYFRQNPEPFYVLAKELYPGKFHPTISHAFIAMLAGKGLLYHLFTQNIDCLERTAGVPDHLIVEAHGSFATQRCIECKTPFPDEEMRDYVSRGAVPRCVNAECNGLVKPDIVFFGEQLPQVFRDRQHYPGNADLAIVMGTSLTVHPFAGLPDAFHEDTPRLLFNLERVGSLGSRPDDVLCLDDCDAGVRKLADELGWREELEAEWRSIVGHKEAERQLHGAEQRTREKEMAAEMEKLTGEVEEVLHLHDDHDANAEDHDAVKEKPDDNDKVDTSADPSSKPAESLGAQSKHATVEDVTSGEEASQALPAKDENAPTADASVSGGKDGAKESRVPAVTETGGSKAKVDVTTTGTTHDEASGAAGKTAL